MDGYLIGLHILSQDMWSVAATGARDGSIYNFLEKLQMGISSFRQREKRLKPLRSWPRALWKWKKRNKSWIGLLLLLLLLWLLLWLLLLLLLWLLLFLWLLLLLLLLLFRSPIHQLPPKKKKNNKKHNSYFLAHCPALMDYFSPVFFHPSLVPMGTFHPVVGPPPRRMPGLESWTKHQMPRAGEICASRCWRCSSSVVWSWCWIDFWYFSSLFNPIWGRRSLFLF